MGRDVCGVDCSFALGSDPILSPPCNPGSDPGPTCTSCSQMLFLACPQPQPIHQLSRPYLWSPRLVSKETLPACPPAPSCTPSSRRSADGSGCLGIRAGSGSSSNTGSKSQKELLLLLRLLGSGISHCTDPTLLCVWGRWDRPYMQRPKLPSMPGLGGAEVPTAGQIKSLGWLDLACGLYCAHPCPKCLEQ